MLAVIKLSQYTVKYDVTSQIKRANKYSKCEEPWQVQTLDLN